MYVQEQHGKVHIPVFSSKKGRQEEKREKGKVRLEIGKEVGALSAMRHGVCVLRRESLGFKVVEVKGTRVKEELR